MIHMICHRKAKEHQGECVMVKDSGPQRQIEMGFIPGLAIMTHLSYDFGYPHLSLATRKSTASVELKTQAQELGCLV